MMGRVRISMAALLGAVLYSGLILAALRSGSDVWFRSVYTLTAAALLYGGVAARHRGAFWHGFAVVGIGYFIVGFGPWIAGPPGSNGRGLNRNLITSMLVDAVTEPLARPGQPPPGHVNEYYMMLESRKANLNGIVHAVLTTALATVGGFTSRTLAARRRRGDPTAVILPRPTKDPTLGNF